MVTVAVDVAIAGRFASTIISKLIDKASTYFKDQKAWQSGMKDEVKRLSDSQLQVMTLVYAAERGDLQGDPNPALVEWLGKLRDAVEDADNVLDELEYQRLEEEADEPPAKKLLKRIAKFGVRAVQQDDVLKRLREVVKTFDELVAGLGTFTQVLSWLDGRTATEVRGEKGRETGRIFTEDEFFGRKKEKQMVIHWLNNSESKIISVFSIVGVGGVGKTALAQNLFDHPGLDFQIKMWVCVSTSFEEKAIIMKMLESLTKEKHEFTTLDAAQSILKEKITGKKFLLVLDDVWNDEEREKWNKVMAPLKYGFAGSKILLSTRMKSVANTVAKVVGETKRSLNLNSLEEWDNLLLFEKYAFAGFNPNEYARLRLIGNKIAKKLRVPLAVKTIGGMLNYKLEEEYWSRVLEDGALNLDKGTDGIKAAIRLSYEHLPPEFKPCFRYCSIFPPDHEFDKGKLVDVWISIGLIPEGEKSQEELASDLFDTLVRKSFFEPKASYYSMHDLLHELAQILSKNECLRVVSNDPIQIPQSIRHLSLRTNNILVLKNLSELKYLRTLLLFCEIEDAELTGAIDTALKGLKTIRWLELSSKWLRDFPKSIGDLVHLRCLSITRTDIPKLSQCVCSLYHLQILEFINNPSFDHSEGSIPADICKLSKLKRLHLPSGAISTIPRIGKLSSLQQLMDYSVKGEAGYDISELEMMSELRELVITNLENVRSTEEASKAKLHSKKHLHYISLSWGHGIANIEGRNEMDKEVADCLQPGLNLTNLLLNGYRAINLPNWLRHQIVPNVTSINLAYCSSLERLPPFGQLPYLKFLTLEKLIALKEIGLEFYGSSQSGNTFPALENLDLLIQLDEWREDTQSEKWFPRLKILRVHGCPSLKKLPPIPTSLKELKLMFLGTTTLPEFKQKNGECNTNQGPWSLSSLYIYGCSKLTSLKSGFFMHLEQLASLENLNICNCAELVQLPLDGFRELICLKSLRIDNCRRLFLLPLLLPKNFFPPSIQRLMLHSCGDLVACLPQLLLDLSLLCSLELVNCANLISLPSANVLQSLTSLKELKIHNCEGLKSLGGLEGILTLKVLVIKTCPNLATKSPLDSIEQSSRNRLSMALDQLDIDQPEILLALPNIHVTRLLEISGSHGINLLPEQWLLQNGASLRYMGLLDLRSVETLPDSLQSLPSLRVLVLHNAYKLTRLPELPRSLEVLEILGCSEELDGRLKEGGLDYDKIRHLDVTVLGVGSQSIISQLIS
ncbi:putative disease resistance protein RGA3 [Carex rostrata]